MNSSNGNESRYNIVEMVDSNLTFVGSLIKEYKGNIILENSTEPNSLNDDDNDNVVIKIHGSFMLLAWLLFASNGIFTARHARDMFSRWTCTNGNDIWYGVHLICMIMTWFLSIVSVIVMFIGHGFDCLKKEKISENPHSLIGIITISLLFFQPFIACFRPPNNSSNRKWFNGIHSLIGVCCISLSLCAMIFATTLAAAKLDSTSRTAGFVFIGFLFGCDQIMTITKKNKLIVLGRTIYVAFVVGSLTMTFLALLFLLL